MQTEPKSRILEALSKFAETSRRGTGSAIGHPEQSSPSDHPFRPAGAPELVLSKNTNELKTGAPGRFGSETSEAWLANGS